MLTNFRTYQLATEFYRAARAVRLPGHLRDQLSRAASSVVLNLAEGSGRRTPADQKRFYNMAFASLRECQACLELADGDVSAAVRAADATAASLWRLLQSRRP
jgi:four helix bundle protein